MSCFFIAKYLLLFCCINHCKTFFVLPTNVFQNNCYISGKILAQVYTLFWSFQCFATEKKKLKNLFQFFIQKKVFICISFLAVVYKTTFFCLIFDCNQKKVYKQLKKVIPLKISKSEVLLENQRGESLIAAIYALFQ